MADLQVDVSRLKVNEQVDTCVPATNIIKCYYVYWNNNEDCVAIEAVVYTELTEDICCELTLFNTTGKEIAHGNAKVSVFNSGIRTDAVKLALEDAGIRFTNFKNFHTIPTMLTKVAEGLVKAGHGETFSASWRHDGY